MRYLYLAPWQWQQDADIPYWRAPNGNALGCFDLRSLPQQGIADGTPQGFGLFAYDYDPAIRGGLLLATGLDGALQAAKSRLQNALGVTLDASSPREVLWEILTTRADPTGQTRWKPLRGSLRRPTRMGLDDSLRVSMGPEILAATVGVFQADYRRNRAEGMATTTLRRWTGSAMRKLFGRMNDSLAAQILPPEMVGDGWGIPATTIGDTFVDPNGTSLDAHTASGPNGGFTWTEVLGDWQILTGDYVYISASVAGQARADSDLSTDDMYAQIGMPVNPAPPAPALWGADTRFSPSANTAYVFVWRASNTRYEIQKVVTGTYTLLFNGASTVTAAGDVIKGQSQDSALEIFRNGGSEASGSDSAITGNVRAGIHFNRGSATGFRMDSFEAADLAAGGIAPAVALYHQRYHNKAV